MASVIVRNILVGHGNLYVAAMGTALPTTVTASGGDADLIFDGDAAWTSVGATQGGVEIGYDPDYGEVEVDQMKDAAVMFNNGVTVTMTTNLAEATLENLLIAWGVDDSALTNGERFAIGVPGDEPTERAAAVTGRAPRTAAGDARERVYYARRAVSVEGSTHGLQNGEATTFPTTFRMLPYRGPAGTSFIGEEYGVIIDRLTS